MADSLPLGLTWAAFWLHLLGERIAVRRTGRPRDRLARRRALAFYAGLLMIVISIATPIETYSKQLLWTHMIQHVLLLSVAAPLIVLGAPWMSLWRPLPLGMRRTLARAFMRSPRLAPVRWVCRIISRPVGALVAYSVNLLVWHLPALYDAALRNSSVHALEHLTFMGFGILLWAQVIDSPPARATLGYPGQDRAARGRDDPQHRALDGPRLLALADLPLLRPARPPARRDNGVHRPADRGGDHVGRPVTCPFAIAVVVLAVQLAERATRSPNAAPPSSRSRRLDRHGRACRRGRRTHRAGADMSEQRRHPARAASAAAARAWLIVIVLLLAVVAVALAAVRRAESGSGQSVLAASGPASVEAGGGFPINGKRAPGLHPHRPVRPARSRSPR